MNGHIKEPGCSIQTAKVRSLIWLVDGIIPAYLAISPSVSDEENAYKIHI